MSETDPKFLPVLTQLTGQPVPFVAKTIVEAGELLESSGWGHSQLNEVLLTLGYDRVSPAFFQYLANGEVVYVAGTSITTVAKLKVGVDRFRKFALLRFGNIKYAFKNLSILETDELAMEVSIVSKIDEGTFTKRHAPVHPINRIPGDKTYYLGYIVEREVNERLKQDPNDQEARSEQNARKAFVECGKRNHAAYLASDHMDVYVATSMRERQDFYIINEITSEVFGNEALKKLKLRYFDPTQAYCSDRVDKGLAEALMLKRAKCTLYLAQEGDTLGKDSELASTLAQGKPVIAYVPSVNDDEKLEFARKRISIAEKLYPNRCRTKLIRDQLQLFAPQLAWTDERVRTWLSDSKALTPDEIEARLADSMQQHYDKRAQTLQKTHPLGIQVHLETGVANGVLVARTEAQCAKLIHGVITNQLEFDIIDDPGGICGAVVLQERISKSAFRVATGDAMLTNAFWNFYLT